MRDPVGPFRCVHPDGEGAFEHLAGIDNLFCDATGLSGQFVVACALLGDGVGVADFSPAALADAARLALAAKIRIAIDDNPDPNALSPVTVAVILKDGRRFEARLNAIYGAPANPMTHDAHLAKFRNNFAMARPRVPASQGEALIEAVDRIESTDDVRRLIDLCIAPEGASPA